MFFKNETRGAAMLKKMLFGILISTWLVLVLGFFACDQKPAEPVEPADLVLINGKILTVDEAYPEAQALAAGDGIVLSIGSNDEIKPYIGENTEVIDLEGKLAVPGLIDAHAHFTSVGHAKLGLDLTKVNNWDEVVSMVEEAVKEAEPGQWIQGRGWHQEKWDRPPEPNVDGLPFHDSISQISPENPVLLTHASGHSCFANAKAMELAEIDKDTVPPEGGEIVKDAEGNPIGIFRETAQWPLSQALYIYLDGRTLEEKTAEQIEIIELADKECLSKGLTSLHDAGSSFNTIEIFREFVEEGKLGIRLYVMINEPNQELEIRLDDYMLIGLGDNHLTVRSVKRLIDGALGAHGAWLLEPYKSLPSSSGLNTTSVEVMKETARIAIEKGFQLNTHAIGDRANRETLNIYEEAFLAHQDKTGLRWRIEHAQHLHPNDIPRFGELKVIPSMQTIHCTSDGPWVIKRLGEQRAEEGAYVWRKLMDSGARICNGTDAPVEDVDPIPNFYAAVTRKMKTGEAFYPDQCMTREEALRSYTMNAAYAAFEEDIKGSLAKGKLADVTVLSQDIMTIPEEDILKTEVIYTIVGGKVLYKK